MLMENNLNIEESNQTQQNTGGGIVERLGKKIDTLLIKFNELKEENLTLQNELSALRGQQEAKERQVRKLEEDLAMKDLEVEDILSKIEQVISR